MSAYRETFRRHRVLFALPAVLAALAVAALTLTTPPSYESFASLWVDNGPAAGSSLGNANQTVEPSAVEDTTLTELLATQTFDLAVGDGSSLKRSVASSGGTAKTIATAVAAGVGSTTPGPQVLQITFTGATPQVAQSTLSSLITQLENSTTRFGEDFGKTAQAYYQGQVRTATQAVSRAAAASAAYLRRHPSVTVQTDQNYAALVAAVGSATSQLATAKASLNQAAGQAQGSAAATTIRVIDPASVPTGPLSGKKKAAMEVVGAILAGMLISLLIIVAITPSGQDRWDEEMSGTTTPPPAPVWAAPPAPVWGGQPAFTLVAPANEAKPAPAAAAPIHQAEHRAASVGPLELKPNPPARKVAASGRPAGGSPTPKQGDTPPARLPAVNAAERSPDGVPADTDAAAAIRTLLSRTN